MALKDDVQDVRKEVKTMKAEVLQQTNVLIAESVDPVKNELADVKESITRLSARVDTAETGNAYPLGTAQQDPIQLRKIEEK